MYFIGFTILKSAENGKVTLSNIIILLIERKYKKFAFIIKSICLRENDENYFFLFFFYFLIIFLFFVRKKDKKKCILTNKQRLL